jgi:hypothetical protein
MKKLLHNLISTFPIVLYGLLFSLPAHAFFTHTQFSDANQMTALSLYLTLSIEEAEKTSRTVLVTNESTLPFTYTIRAEEVPHAENSFCDEIGISVNGEEPTGLLLFSKNTAPLDIADSESLAFEFSVSNSDADISGRQCVVELLYEATQEGFSYGEAFSDRETDLFVLYGDDFATVPDNPVLDDTFSAEDCKNGGWQREAFASFSFAHQGHCVSHFASGGTSTEARNRNQSGEETTLSAEVLGRSLLTQPQLSEETQTEPFEDEEVVIEEQAEEAVLNDEDVGADSEEEDEENAEETTPEEGVLEEQEE